MFVTPSKDEDGQFFMQSPDQVLKDTDFKNSIFSSKKKEIRNVRRLEPTKSNETLSTQYRIVNSSIPSPSLSQLQTPGLLQLSKYNPTKEECTLSLQLNRGHTAEFGNPIQKKMKNERKDAGENQPSSKDY